MMNTKMMSMPGFRVPNGGAISIHRPKPVLLFIFLLLSWFFLPGLLHQIDETAGNVDQSIWLLVVLSLIGFLLICGLCWWMLRYFWMILELPSIDKMVSQFKFLPLWQQLSFYYASFALLLLAAMGCLIAIC